MYLLSVTGIVCYNVVQLPLSHLNSIVIIYI